MQLTEAERRLAEELGIIEKERGKKGKKEREYKVIRGTTTCKLCGTVTTQFIRMMKLEDNTWVKKEELVEEIAKNLNEQVDNYEGTVRFCWACREVLGEKEKDELVQMIINLFNPVLTRQEIWKHVKKLREEEKIERDSKHLVHGGKESKGRAGNIRKGSE
jgi:L-lactate utilization protein LutC